MIKYLFGLPLTADRQALASDNFFALLKDFAQDFLENVIPAFRFHKDYSLAERLSLDFLLLQSRSLYVCEIELGKIRELEGMGE